MPSSRLVPTGLVAALTGVLFHGITAPASAQEVEFQAIPWSQRASVTQRVGYTDIAITYSRPVARGRTLFGGVVRWDRIWNPGADSATTITFSRDVEIEGRAVPAGAYTLWIIPREHAAWTVIVSGRSGIYHRPYPGDEYDVVRFDVMPEIGEHMETLAFYFPVVQKESAALRMHWGDTVVPIDIAARDTPYD